MRILLLTLCLSGLLYVSMQAQDDRSPHSIGAKLLFIDYGTPNDIDSLNITNGLEVVYGYSFSNFLSLALPFKVGVANVVDDINNKTFVSVDALLQAHLTKPSSKVIPYLFGGAGIVLDNFDKSNVQIPLGLGFNFRAGKNSFINLQGEYRFSTEDNRNNLQGGLGYIYRIGQGMKDTDKDGTPDVSDECPQVPGPKETAGCPDRDKDGVADQDDLCPDEAGTPATNGCPDMDKDGLADNKDKCPTIPGTINGCPDTDSDGIADEEDQCPNDPGTLATRGCPDRDNDGVADQFDQCPDEAGTPANNGCPVADADKDGVPDIADKCPNEAGTVAAMGCPDRDGDGIADADDRCPDKAGPYAGCPDTDGDGVIDADDLCPEEAGLASNKGCPEIKQEVKEVLEFAMRAVQFETGKATLKPESYAVLDQIVQIMKEYPAYALRISGHTDNVGADSANQILSEQRAKACYEHLVVAGIASDRITYAGFGESRPITSNNSAEGRRLNRRVEFELFIK